MPDERRWDRRRWLGVVGFALAGGTAGCAERGDASDGSIDLSDDAPCADGFRITETAVDIQTGAVPRVRLRLDNTGETPIEYELVVIFQQGTSLGIEARTGRTTLSGTLEPGESVQRTATDDATDIRNTDTYDLSVSLSCPGS